MRAAEIISQITWSPDTDPASIAAVEDAIIQLDAKSRQSNNRPVVSEIQLYRRLEIFIERAGSAKAAAAQLGISPSFLSQIRHAGRSMPAHVVHRLGYQKKREFEGI